MQIDERLVEFVMSDLARGKISGNLDINDNLIDASVVDSLGIMKLIIFLEENYSIKVTDDDLTPENFSSIMTIQSLVLNKMSEAGNA
jgi:acyl carrier protein